LTDFLGQGIPVHRVVIDDHDAKHVLDPQVTNVQS
jgi:hypothetical protein